MKKGEGWKVKHIKGFRHLNVAFHAFHRASTPATLPVCDPSPRTPTGARGQVLHRL